MPEAHLLEEVLHREIFCESRNVYALNDDGLGLSFVEVYVLTLDQKEAAIVRVEIDFRNIRLIKKIKKHHRILVVKLGLPKEIKMMIVDLHNNNIVVYRRYDRRRP